MATGATPNGPSVEAFVADPLALAVDSAGRGWVVDAPAQGTLTIGLLGGPPPLRLDAGQGERRYGLQIYPMGEGVLLGRILCEDPHCDTAHLMLERYDATDDYAVIQAGSWSSPPASDVAAVSYAGSGEGSLSLRSGSQIGTFADGVGTFIEAPTVSGPACVADGQTYVVIDDGFNQPDQTDAVAVPDSTDEVAGHLVSYRSGSWVEAEGSGFTYPAADGVEPRCSPQGYEIAALGQPAAQIWTGGRWSGSASGVIPWEVAPDPDSDLFGLVGVSEGQIVRVDSATGRTLQQSAPTGAFADRWAGGPGALDSPNPGPPAALLALAPPGSEGVAMCQQVFTETGSTDDQGAECATAP